MISATLFHCLTVLTSVMIQNLSNLITTLLLNDLKNVWWKNHLCSCAQHQTKSKA